MNRRKTILVATLVLSGGTAAALAQGAMAPASRGGASMAPSVLAASDHGYGRGHGHGWRHAGMMRRLMRLADANDDGALTQAEIDDFVARQVASADVDGDADLTIGEFETLFNALLRPRMVDAFQELDEDGDGVITAAEREERFGSIVARFDRNDDGQLDRSDRRRGEGRGRGPGRDREE